MGMRRLVCSYLALLLSGCAVPVGNLVALQGEGIHAGSRLTLGAASPSLLSPSEPPPAFASLEAAWVMPAAYLRAETGILPPGVLFSGGVIGAGLHWKDRIALGGHLALARGSNYGADLTLRPLSASPWIIGSSFTPALEGQEIQADGSIPKITGAHDLELSLGWSPPPDTSGGCVAIEIGLRQDTRHQELAGWIRFSGSARLFDPLAPIRRR